MSNKTNPAASSRGEREAGVPTAYDRLRAMTRGAKGDRPDYGNFLSCADATELLAEIDRARATLSQGAPSPAPAVDDETVKLLAELDAIIAGQKVSVTARRQLSETESLPAVKARPARDGRPALRAMPADPDHGERHRRILATEELRLVALTTARDALARSLRRAPDTPSGEPTPDGGTDGERWSFARRCVQAGYALQWEHIERKGVTYERASAELDALAARLADEPSRAAVRDEPAAGTPSSDALRAGGIACAAERDAARKDGRLEDAKDWERFAGELHAAARCASTVSGDEALIELLESCANDREQEGSDALSPDAAEAFKDDARILRAHAASLRAAGVSNAPR